MKHPRTVFLLLFCLLQTTVGGTQPASTESAADRILIVGATRNTGLEVTRLLVERGTPVVAFARPTSNLEALRALNVEIITGDALIPGDLQRAIDQGPWRVVVTTLSCYRCDNPPDYEGNKNLVDAMRNSASRRLILISTVGANESAAATPWIVEWILKEPIAQKEQAENYLLASELDFTIIRPGGLTEAQPTGDGILTEDPTRMGMISRPDLAGLIVDVIDDDATIGKTYTAIDKNKHWLWDMYGD
ncbi:MAG: SDR family oxidoreductase [Gammaproteobacteria bacterium]|nr:SDR family oxidoreductase [Gammaproteobacteria bacterium]